MNGENYSIETLRKMLKVLEDMDQGQIHLDYAWAQIETYKECRDSPAMEGFLVAAERNIVKAARLGKDVTSLFNDLCDLRAEYQRN